MNTHINKRKLAPKKKSSIQVPFGGNRHARRASAKIDEIVERKHKKTLVKKALKAKKVAIKKANKK